MAPPLAILWASRIAAAPMLEAAIPSHIRDMSTNSTGAVRIIGVIDTGIAEDKIPLLPDVRRARSRTQKKAGSVALPARLVMKLRRESRYVKARSPSAWGLVALKPQKRMGCSSTDQGRREAAG